VLSEAENGYRYVCASRNRPLRELAKGLRESFGGGGGGTDTMIQGSVNASREQLEEFFKQNQ
jgi:alanyl-tRNA synthetase